MKSENVNKLLTGIRTQVYIDYATFLPHQVNMFL
jgi:hypothetical protein